MGEPRAAKRPRLLTTHFACRHSPATSVQPFAVHRAETVPLLDNGPPEHIESVLPHLVPIGVLPHASIHLAQSSKGTFFMPLLLAQGGGGGAASGNQWQPCGWQEWEWIGQHTMPGYVEL
jgi:hypothetical protein